MSAWGLPAAGSAWASQVDDEEAENGGELEAPSEKETAKPAKFTPSARAAAAAGGGGLAPPINSAAAFPSLGESLTIKETKAERKAKEQKAKKKLSLAEFMAPSSGGGGGSGSGGGYRPPGASSSSSAAASTALLPTAPRARAEGEDDDRDGRGGQRLGGAFKDGEHRYAAQDRSRSRERGGGGFGDRERGERRGGEKKKRWGGARQKNQRGEKTHLVPSFSSLSPRSLSPTRDDSNQNRLRLRRRLRRGPLPRRALEQLGRREEVCARLGRRAHRRPRPRRP